MFDKKDILKLLQEGKTSDEIAQAFTDSLNGALTEQKKQDQKSNELKKVIKVVKSFLKEYYPNIMVNFDESDLKNFLDNIDEISLKSYKKSSSSHTSSPIEDFLKHYGLF